MNNEFFSPFLSLENSMQLDEKKKNRIDRIFGRNVSFPSSINRNWNCYRRKINNHLATFINSSIIIIVVEATRRET